jgi:hypothetical protein
MAHVTTWLNMMGHSCKMPLFMDVRFWCITFFNPWVLAMVELSWESLLGHFICSFSFLVYFAWFVFICNHIEKAFVVVLSFQSPHWHTHTHEKKNQFSRRNKLFMGLLQNLKWRKFYIMFLVWISKPFEFI